MSGSSQRSDAAPSPGRSDAATPVVGAFYDRFPYPGDPLQDGPPPGYNWRWCHRAVMAACRGVLPRRDPFPLRILDAGCGTGVSTDYLALLNPGADILAVDISRGALEVARERLRRSRGGARLARLRQEQRSLLDLAGEGPFQLINSVGVLHHLHDPAAGLSALAGLLAPDGVMHLFLYARGGRWEIHRCQRAFAALGFHPDPEGVGMARQVLASLPENNPLRRCHESRWALDTRADANFADMYLHPQETSYDLDGLFALIEGCGLAFAGFSNPDAWDPARLLRGEALERARALPLRDRWRLVESLDPTISHFEFFLTVGPCRSRIPSGESELLALTAERSPCLWGYPGASLLDRDLAPLDLSPPELALLGRLEEAPPGTPLAALAGGAEPADHAATVRSLAARHVLLLRES
jgi:SAM-dependent methyltransferase